MTTISIGARSRLTQALKDLEWDLGTLAAANQINDDLLNSAIESLGQASDRISDVPESASDRLNAANDFLKAVQASRGMETASAGAAGNALKRARIALAEME